jgi:hypothetical protein
MRLSCSTSGLLPADDTSETLQATVEPEDDDNEEEWEERDIGVIQERVFAWCREWVDAPEYAALSDEQKNRSVGIVRAFTEYMRTHHGLVPEEWNDSDMTVCCIETLPAKVSSDEGYFLAIAPVLSSLFTFLGRTKRLADAASMAAQIRCLSDRIVREARNPLNWGPAKNFAMSAMAASVDVDNHAEVQAFVAKYNARIAARPVSSHDTPWLPRPGAPTLHEQLAPTRIGPKIGRNDPCPCGSGRKYKMCCAGC